MIDSNDIFTRLQNGEDVNVIASEMTAALNEANKKYKAEQDKKTAEIQKQKEADKKNDLQDILADLTDWLNIHYDWDLEMPTMDDVNMTIEAINAVGDLLHLVETPKSAEKKKPATKPQTKNTDKTIADFLIKMGW